MIEITFQEAESIVDEMAREGKVQLASEVKAQSIAGVCVLGIAMQRLGWRIARPLRAVTPEAEPAKESGVQGMPLPVPIVQAAIEGMGLDMDPKAEKLFAAKIDSVLQYFAYEHLPPHLQEVSRPFEEMAFQIVKNLPRNPERTVALRKLLEAKDAAVRAKIFKE